MAHRDFRLGLTGLQLATFATLLRSVALDRWITVAVSVGLLVATYVAMRGRTWGVALSFALGAALLGITVLGVAPLWFAFVGLLAMRPFIGAFPLFARFDRGAAVALTVLAGGFGALGAVAWKEYALALFQAFPALYPSIYPHHGAAVVALVAGALAARRFLPRPEAVIRADASTEATRIRIAEVTSQESVEEAASYDELESELAPHPSRSITQR